MEKKLCPFGAYLTDLRKQHSEMPQWLLAAKCEIVPANLRKIEKGVTQPGVMLAIRIVRTLGEDVGEVFAEIASKEGLLIAVGKECKGLEQPVKDLDIDSIVREHVTNNDCKCLFGPLFRAVRMKMNVSQQNVAHYADYHQRNILEVEKGKREPGVMTALALVCATGCDVSWFFNSLLKYSLKSCVYTGLEGETHGAKS